MKVKNIFNSVFSLKDGVFFSELYKKVDTQMIVSIAELITSFNFLVNFQQIIFYTVTVVAGNDIDHSARAVVIESGVTNTLTGVCATVVGLAVVGGFIELYRFKYPKKTEGSSPEEEDDHPFEDFEEGGVPEPESSAPDSGADGTGSDIVQDLTSGGDHFFFFE